MKHKLISTLPLLLLSAILMTAFTPLPTRLLVTPSRKAAIATTLHPEARQGDTLIAYLADDAGNLATAFAIIDSTSPDSFYVRLAPIHHNERNYSNEHR